MKIIYCCCKIESCGLSVRLLFRRTDDCKHFIYINKEAYYI